MLSRREPKTLAFAQFLRTDRLVSDLDRDLIDQVEQRPWTFAIEAYPACFRVEEGKKSLRDSPTGSSSRSRSHVARLKLRRRFEKR